MYTTLRTSSPPASAPACWDYITYHLAWLLSLPFPFLHCTPSLTGSLSRDIRFHLTDPTAVTRVCALSVWHLIVAIILSRAAAHTSAWLVGPVKSWTEPLATLPLAHCAHGGCFLKFPVAPLIGAFALCVPSMLLFLLQYQPDPAV